MQAGFLDRYRPVILILVAIAARGLTFGNPVVHADEEFYYVTAHEMWRGALPFIDIWDRKPIGLFLLYLPAAGLPLSWGIVAYQALASASLVLTALIVARLAERAGWGVGATVAAIAYVLWPDLLNGVGGQSPIFYNLPMAAAGLLIAGGEGGGGSSHRRGAAAMALVGIALQIKYSVVFEGIYFGLWLMWRDWRSHRAFPATLAYGAMLAAIALVPTAMAWGFYAAIGQSDAFLFANFLSVGHRNANPLAEMLGNIGTLMLLLGPLVAMAFAARRQETTGGSAELRHFLFGWLSAALVGLAVFGTWFDHYGLPVLVPGCVCAAGFFGARQFRARVAPAVVGLVAIGGLATVLAHIHGRGNAVQFAALTQAVGHGPGCLYVYSGTTMLYAATERCRLSRYVVPAHLNRAREDGATGVDQAAEARRILAARPAVVVMRPPFGGERRDIRAFVSAAMARDYRLARALPMGDETVTVYKLKD